MDRYTLAVTSPDDWNTIHNALIIDSNEDGIPDRKVTCSDCKEHSSTRGTYELTEQEANEIAKHPKVKWIELSPSDHPYVYPKPEPATKRFKKDVKIYRDISAGGSNVPPGITTAGELDRTNWAVKRVGIATNGDSWPNVTGNPPPIFDDISYSLTGKNVDVVIQDSGILQYHPEFIQGNGESRVRDIVLDGPYYIDPEYFTSNGYTYTKPDGRTGITTASAHGWWENSSNRSASFSSAGTVTIDNNYTVARSIGIGGSAHNFTSGHGTGCAGLSAGKNFGLAFEANLWNINIFGDIMEVETSYDVLKIFHQNKPNVQVGNKSRKNPTVVNGSWGYQGRFNSNTNVSYKFRGETGTFTGNDAVGLGTGQLARAMKEGLNNQVIGAYKSWSTSSGSNSRDTAGGEMIDAGVIFVAAAGNNNQRLGIGAADPDRLNYMTSTVGSDPRAEFPSGTKPCGHRDWMNPQGIGFNSTTDYHPVICCGAMEEYIGVVGGAATYEEGQASYSNNGPGIDIWAPADETLSAGIWDTDETNYVRRDDANFADRFFNGTSAAAPVVTGLVALFLESNPSATSVEVKNFLANDGSKLLPDSEWVDQYTNASTTDYWTESYNNRGALNKVAFDPYASDTIPSISGVIGGESIVTNGLILNLDGNNYTSGTTWNDLSGNGYDATLTNGPTYNSDNGGYFIFDGTNDHAVIDSSFQVSTSGTYSFEAWIYKTSTSVNNAGMLISGGYGGDIDGIIISSEDYALSGSIRVFSLGGTCAAVYYNGVSQTLRGDSIGTNETFNLNEWIHIAVTGITVNNTDGAAHHIGQNNNNTNEFGGRISNIKLYNRTLTASEVIHNFDAMKGRFEQRPLILSGVSYTQA